MVAHHFDVDGQMRGFLGLAEHWVVESVLVGVAFHGFTEGFCEDKAWLGGTGLAD